MSMTNPGRLALLLALAVLTASCGDDASPATSRDPQSSSSAEGTASTSEADPPAVEALRDISYWDDDLRHMVDVYLPIEVEEPLPTILAIHGGGFRARSKSLYSAIGPHFADTGHAFVAMNYRLAPGSTYPTQVEDSFCALAWIHDNASEYGFDTDRVVVWGGSAGGYLAAMIATVSDPSIYLDNCPNQYPEGEALQAAIIFYGFFDFTNVDDLPENEVGAFETFWGAPYEEISDAQLEEMSPIMQIDGTEPPFLLLHGTSDTTIPSFTSERFEAALEQAGVEVDLVLLPGAGHAFELTPLDSDELTLAFSEIDEFLARSLD